ncbi:hypothetical protein SMF913_26350 [Streptomyces malaysiensis]|uniref:SUKH-4 immunity protein of toxin-antitoxin system n=1 Tax=Streptomyces malaysiensis TaxID=92644 RepID=A0A2J7YS80_STRMQ|nr:hypothetical protein SMF913_26350 [Streptomyces malaysiensis]
MFGEDFVRRVPEEHLGGGFSREVRRLLAEVGVPYGLGDMITISSRIVSEGLPTLAEVFGKYEKKAPAGISQLRRFGVLADSILCLNGKSGEVFLLLDEDSGETVLVNSSLDRFLNFLCLLEDARKRPLGGAGVPEDEQEAVLSRLEEIDPEAVDGSHLWRSVARAVL